MAIDDVSTLYRRARASGFDDPGAWDFACETLAAEIESFRAEMALRNLADRIAMLGGRAAVKAVVKGLGETSEI